MPQAKNLDGVGEIAHVTERSTPKTSRWLLGAFLLTSFAAVHTHATAQEIDKGRDKEMGNCFAAVCDAVRNRLFVASGTPSMHVSNVSSGRLHWVTTVYDEGYYRNIKISGDRAFVADASRGLMVFHISKDSPALTWKWKDADGNRDFGANCQAREVRKSADSAKGNTYKTMSAEELLSKTRAGTRCILIDCRPKEEFRAGHIPGAVNISIDSYTFGKQTVLKSSLGRIIAQVGRRMNFVLIDSSSNEQYMPRTKLLELMRLLPEDRNREVIFYCRRPECTRSPLAIRWALALGYKNIWRFAGGWKEWSAKKYPVAKT
jgi:rhodanese-related sulfurtransferase